MRRPCTGAGDVIHVAVDESLSPVRLPGTRLHRLVRFEERVQWSASPPRVRLEDALSSMAGDAPTRADDLAVVADACRRRVTTPERLAGELRSHPRLRRRRWMLDVLDEASAGVQSLLESTYRRRVERAHGLPTPERQVRERTEHDGHPRRAATWSSGSSRTCLRATTVTR